jgi:hypothetical protein
VEEQVQFLSGQLWVGSLMEKQEPPKLRDVGSNPARPAQEMGSTSHGTQLAEALLKVNRSEED